MDKIFEWFLPIKKDDGMVLRGIRVGETAPIVRMHLIDDSGKGADITGVDAVSVIVERSDGMKVALTLSVQAVLCFCPAVVELSFGDARLSAVAGLCVGVIDFYSGDVRMTSARFRYNVEPGIDVSDNDVAQDPEYSMFVGAMTDLAMLNKEVSEAESARNVFEVFDPYKEYVRGNKVAFGGSSYVLIAESAVGTNPTDTGSWLCIAGKGERGENGSRYFGFPNIDIDAGEMFVITFNFDDMDKNDYPDIDEWCVGDMLLSENGKVLKLVNIVRSGNEVRWIDVLCIADIKGSGGECIFTSDDYGNVVCGDNRMGCMAYYIKSIDLVGKKIYLSETKAVPVIGSVDNTDTSFATPGYDVGDGFSIVNKNHYNNCGTIVSVVNNVVTYSEDSLGFTEIYADNDGGIADYTFRVWGKPDIGVVFVTKYAFAVGSDNKALGSFSSAEGGGNVADGFYSHVEGLNNYAAYGAHAEGGGNMAVGNESHAEGHGTVTLGGNAHAEGQNTVAKGGGSHAEGMGTQALGSQSHSEGLNTVAKGAQSHAEGVGTKANAFASHVEGNGTVASNAQAHAEGYQTIASGQSSHVEGQDSEASGNFSHAQGMRAKAAGYAAFSSGADTVASGDVSVAMGKNAKATGRASMAVGEDVNADAYYAMALGRGVSAKQQGQIVVGMYNADDADAVFIVGGGTASARKNVFAVKKDGRVFASGKEIGGITVDTNLDESSTNPIANFAVNAAVRELSSVQSALSVMKAEADLSNVTNADFKAKAEEAGVGSGGLMDEEAYMVFKGVVDALPTSANENDVYTVSPWENEGTYSNISMSLYRNSVDFSEWNDLADFLYGDVQSYYGCSYKFVIGGASYIYTECGVNSAGEYGFGMAGQTDDVTSAVSVSGATVTVYRANAGADVINKSYIYRGGEWIPLFG